MDLFAGKKLMDEGITAEALDAITGDIMPTLTEEEALKIAHARVCNLIIEDKKQPEKRRERAARGFHNRSEERKAKRALVAKIRRYHRYADGQRDSDIQARRIRKKRANVARRLSNA